MLGRIIPRARCPVQTNLRGCGAPRWGGWEQPPTPAAGLATQARGPALQDARVAIPSPSCGLGPADPSTDFLARFVQKRPHMKTRNPSSRGLALIALSSFLGAAGCEPCPAIYVPSTVRLTLHLPPETAVARPETATVCRQPDCAIATLPRGPKENEIVPVSFTLASNITADAVGDRVEGSLVWAAGDVRLLTIHWNLDEDAIQAASPSSYFDVEVKDATGKITGRLSDGVTYKHITGCGNNAWQAELHD
jgi:hypothetical protein